MFEHTTLKDLIPGLNGKHGKTNGKPFNGFKPPDLPQLLTPANGNGNRNFAKLMSSKGYLEENMSNKVMFDQPILVRDNQGIIYPNTVNVVQGKTGTHKSRLIEGICSVVLSDETGHEFLAYHKKPLNQKEYAVLYVDTERNWKDQYLYALQQIKQKAGYSLNAELPNFDFISLIDIPRAERFETLRMYLQHIRRQLNQHILIVLDVITDCIVSFNDVKESLELTDMINTMINNEDVTFLCIIHENPADQSNKARGHLGTELLNKASSALQIGFEKDKHQNNTDLIKLTYLKVRRGRTPEPFFVQYDDETNGLILADNELVDKVMSSKKAKAYKEDIKAFMGELITEPIDRQDLIKALTLRFDCGQRTIDDRLKQIIDREELIHDHAGKRCRLEKRKEGKQVIFGLEPVNEEKYEGDNDLPL